MACGHFFKEQGNIKSHEKSHTEKKPEFKPYHFEWKVFNVFQESFDVTLDVVYVFFFEDYWNPMCEHDLSLPTKFFVRSVILLLLVQL